MLIPICCERLPLKLEISVVSARGLPVMNKSINCTEAFVEVRFNDTTEKTEVITDLDPVWNSEYFEYETDEKQLFEELVEFRVMDHDTYTTNDAIGRVELDGNVLIESLRQSGENCMDQHIVLPVWDTLYGVRGYLMIGVRITLLVPTNFYYYVQILSGDEPSGHLQIREVVGLVASVQANKDPEHEWLDRIRPPRATNESRQAGLRAALRCAAAEVAEKAHKAGAQMVLGYREAVDIEGSPSDCFCVRAHGTAVVVCSTSDVLAFNVLLTYPIVTVGTLPLHAYNGTGPMLAARTVCVFEDGDTDEASRKRYWAELRNELLQQAHFIGCNAVAAYSEEVRVYDGTALLSCCGTAVRYGNTVTSSTNGSTVAERTSDELLCAPYHAAIDPEKMPKGMKLYPCNWCKKELCPELTMSTAPCPPPQLLQGNKNYIQVSMAKRLTTDSDERDELATELSNVLPSMDRDLLNALIVEGKSVNAQGNAYFEIRNSSTISDGFLVSVVTAVLVRLSIIQRDEDKNPSLPAVLSFTSLQRHNDSRRFSWGSVREAIRLKPSQAPAVSLKILHLKRSSMMESVDEESKLRGRLNTLVSRMRRRQHEKEKYMSHMVMERQLTTSIGVIEAGLAVNSNTIAGLHFAPPSISFVLNREQATGSKLISRWSQIFIREDTSGAVRDATSLDVFVSSCMEECLAMARGALSTCCGTAFTSLALPSTHLSVSRDQAQLVVLICADFATSTSPTHVL